MSFVFLTVIVPSVLAETVDGGRYLTASDLQRVRAFKALLGSVDTQSFQTTVRELENSRHPGIELTMKEAMARAYVDIVQEINVQGQKKREWLYSMVCLNMAYLQFGGSQGAYGSTTELNRLIRKKLTEYLPAHALNQPGFVYSLE